MSFCQAVNTYFGIVMAADKRMMTPVDHSTFQLTDNAKKLFLTSSGYGVSYCGAASINGIPTEYYINKYINEMTLDLSVEESAIAIAESLKALKCENIILIVSGYYNKEAYICFNNTLSPSEVNVGTTLNDKPSLHVRYAGRMDIAEKYRDGKILKYDYNSFTLKDATQFLAFLNYAVASELHFAQTIQDVSLDCDILIITDKEAKWTTGLQNLIMCN